MNDIDEYNEEEDLYQFCPKCGRDYDTVDFDFQICSKCGWDVEYNAYRDESVRKPDENDFMNGDADILTDEWY